MRLNTPHVVFSEYDFIRLFFANLSIRGIIKINCSKLGYELIEFYRNKKYSVLFDMQVKKIEGDFVDMSGYIQQAVLGGTPFDVVNPEYAINNFAENGFVENYCLTEEERTEVKRLRLERKSKK